jgi:cytosine/adenosine deaminase-related metal-dependent hydrolase
MNQPSNATVTNRQRLIHAAAIADGTGFTAAPGAILIEDDRTVAIGTPQAMGEVAGSAVEEHLDAVVIPALVNAHAHLDLTHIGPVANGDGFARWAEMVRERRCRLPEEIAASVRQGVRLSRAGGTAIIGDIAGVRSTIPTLTQRDEGLAGVSYLEVFGIGRTQSAAITAMNAAIATAPPLERGVALGVQPHAPYSCGPEMYRAAAALGRPLATHLAETQEEITFVERAEGPLSDMLKNIGVWDETIAGFHRHPIDHVLALLDGRPLLAAHLNYIDDRHLDSLASAPISVAYCPRASAYFGHTHAGSDEGRPGSRTTCGTHRYRDMLASSINVALGTDSILCLDTPDRISVLDDMRFIYRRDKTDPHTLLRMATINGARALAVRQSLVTLAPGESAGLLAVQIDRHDQRDALVQIMENDHAPRWLLGPVGGRNDWFASS